MTRKHLYISGAVLCVCAIAGWLKAGLDDADITSPTDNWTDHSSSALTLNHYTNVQERLRASGLFPVSPEEQAEKIKLAEAAAQAEAAARGIPVFPKIVSASTIDGVAHIHLINGENTLISAKSGDILPSGWRIKTVDLKRVIAEFDDTEEEFPVTAYNLQSPDETAQGTKDP